MPDSDRKTSAHRSGRRNAKMRSSVSIRDTNDLSANDSSARLGDRAGMLPYSALVAADGRVVRTQLGPFAAGEIDAWARIEPAPR